MLGRVVAEPRHRARLVVVVPVERVPADVGEADLPGLEVALERDQVERHGRRTCRRCGSTSRFTCSKVKTMFSMPLAGSVIARASSIGRAGHLPDGEQAVLGPARPPRSSRARNSCSRGPCATSANPASAYACPRAASRSTQLGRLGDQVDDVHPEAVDAPVDPPAHHRVDGLADVRVLPVEVGLLAGEEVQVVLAADLVVAPRRTGRRSATSSSARPRACRARGPRGRGATSTSRAWPSPAGATPRTTRARRWCG